MLRDACCVNSLGSRFRLWIIYFLACLTREEILFLATGKALIKADGVVLLKRLYLPMERRAPGAPGSEVYRNQSGCDDLAVQLRFCYTIG